MVNITVRDVPEPIRSALSAEARRRGQSLQAFLLGVLAQQADFVRNTDLLVEIEEGFARHGGGVPATAPGASEVLAAARAERDVDAASARSGRP